jgi:pimeloyl-ACP methyl ester carboxylesterase
LPADCDETSSDALPPALADTIIPANGIAQAITIAGDAAAPAVVLLHGLGWDARLWRRQVERLAADGWRAIAPDLRGMGRTEKPLAPYTLDLYAADIVALLDALRVERAALVGFSLGGMVALAVAAARPDRIAAAVFACCTTHSTPAGEAATEAMLDRAGKAGARRFAEEQAEAIWSAGWAASHPRAVAGFVEWRAAMDQAALACAFRATYGADLRPWLGRITVPARVIVADSDRFVPVAAGAALAGALPAADLVVVEDAGHMVSIEQPERFDRALFDFLGRAFPPRPRALAGEDTA